jgi:RNase P/RNase MRP subunit p29
MLPEIAGPRERPLAARRTFVKSVSEKVVVEDDPDEDGMPALVKADDEADSPVPVGRRKEVKAVVNVKAAAVTVNNDDPDDDSISDFSQKVVEEKMKKLPPKKTIKEIEVEVAKNTASFDKKTMDGEKKVEKGKEVKVEGKVLKKKPVQNNLSASTVTRLIRMFVIIALAVYRGYYVVQRGNNRILTDPATLAAMEGVETVLVTDAKAGAEAGQGTQGTQPQGGQGRSWGQWVWGKLAAPFESTLTVVGMSYWIAQMLSAPIVARMPSAKVPGGIFDRLLSLYTDGFEGVLEYIFCMLGEYALHAGTILTVTTALTLFSGDCDLSSVGVGVGVAPTVGDVLALFSNQAIAATASAKIHAAVATAAATTLAHSLAAHLTKASGAAFLKDDVVDEVGTGVGTAGKGGKGKAGKAEKAGSGKGGKDKAGIFGKGEKEKEGKGARAKAKPDPVKFEL